MQYCKEKCVWNCLVLGVTAMYLFSSNENSVQISWFYDNLISTFKPIIIVVLRTLGRNVSQLFVKQYRCYSIGKFSLKHLWTHLSWCVKHIIFNRFLSWQNFETIATVQHHVTLLFCVKNENNGWKGKMIPLDNIVVGIFTYDEPFTNTENFIFQFLLSQYFTLLMFLI